jgi:hypothetical protein
VPKNKLRCSPWAADISEKVINERNGKMIFIGGFGKFGKNSTSTFT